MTSYIDRNPELHRFGEILMREVRDPSTTSLLRIVDGDASPRMGVAALRLSALPEEDREAVRRLGSYVIDYVLARLFVLLRDHEDEVVLTAWGTDVHQVSDGLGGELYGTEGWIERFSNHPSPI